MLVVAASRVSIWAAAPPPRPLGDRLRRARWRPLILAGWAGEYVADVVNGIWTVKYDLPLQLTDAVSLVVDRSRSGRAASCAVELVYFWAPDRVAAGDARRPDLGQTFPSVYYFTYFAYHDRCRRRPACCSSSAAALPAAPGAWRVFAITLALRRGGRRLGDC